jgi:hypothetical protein
VIGREITRNKHKQDLFVFSACFCGQFIYWPLQDAGHIAAALLAVLSFALNAASA